MGSARNGAPRSTPTSAPLSPPAASPAAPHWPPSTTFSQPPPPSEPPPNQVDKGEELHTARLRWCAVRGGPMLRRRGMNLSAARRAALDPGHFLRQRLLRQS